MPITRRRRSAATDGEPSRSAAGRARGVRRFALGALVVAAGTAALSLAGPFALRPFADAAHAAGSAGEVSVAFVLDFGGSTGSQVVGCVNVPASDTRYDALTAFAQKKGLSQPGYAPSGLLCSINGIPSSGCGRVVAGGYIYWAYFTGGAHGWTYASSGASGTVGTADVEGWHFENPGSGNPGDPAPRTAPEYNSICGSSTPPTSTTVPTSTTPPTSTTVPTGGSGGTGGGGGGGGRGTTNAATHAHAAHGSAAVASGQPATTNPSTTTSSSAPSATASTRPSDTANSPPSTGATADPTVGLANARHASSGGSGPGPGPMIIGGLLIAALAVAGFTRWRKRPRTP